MYFVLAYAVCRLHLIISECLDVLPYSYYIIYRGKSLRNHLDTLKVQKKVIRQAVDGARMSTQMFEMIQIAPEEIPNSLVKSQKSPRR